MTLCVHLLGQPRLVFDGQPIKFMAPPRTLPLLAYLLLNRNQAVERQQVAFALWPDETEVTARANLRRHLHQLHRALPPASSDRPWLLIDATTLGWNAQADFWLDVAEFEHLGSQAASVEEAAALYVGDLLETVYDDWVFFERERLRSLYFDILAQLVQQHRAQRSYARAMGFARQCLARDPFREDVVRQLIALRYEMGDRAGAIQEYHAFEHLLRQELGVAPMPETRALHELVLRNGHLPESSDRQTPEITAAPAATPATTGAALLPFAGREAEMQQALACWIRATRGHGSLLLVGGEAGVGKSRLVRELALLVESWGGRALVGSSAPYQSRPHQPMVEALESALPLIAASGLAGLRLALLATLLPDLGRRRHLPDLPSLDPAREQVRLYDAVAGCLERLAGARPLLLILEDLHWAQESTIALIEFLARRAAAQPILIIGTYRPEETLRAHALRDLRRRLQADNLVEHLALGCLSALAVQALLARLVTPLFPPDMVEAPAASSLVAYLHAESEGHPLFIELLLHDWRENGRIEPDRLPGGVREAIVRRLERLPGPARAYAEVAAISGLAFDAEVVREVGGWDELQAFDSLDTLLDRRLIRDVESRSRFDYVLAHHLIQATLYAETPPARRRRRHRRMAEVLEELYPEQGNEWAGELARHYDLGGDAARAMSYYLAASRQQLQVYADAEALEALTRGLTLAEALTPVPQQVLFDLLLLRESIYHRRGERARQAADLERLEQLAAALNDGEMACEVLSRRILCYKAMDDHPAHKAAVEALQQQAGRLGSRRWQAAAVFAAGNYAKIVSDYAGAIARLQEALALYEELEDSYPQARAGQAACCCHLAQLFIILRQGTEAEAWAQQAVALCQAHGPTPELMETLWTVAANGLTTKDLERCLSYARRLLKAAERAGDRQWQAAAHRLTGMTYQRQFRIAEARQSLNVALDLYGLIQKPKGCALTLQSLGGLEVSLGHCAAAERYYQQAYDLQQELDDQHGLASEAINLSYVAACRQDYAAERMYARQALEHLRHIQNRFLEATALQNLGEAEREIGDLAAGRRYLDQALALLDDPSLIGERASVLADLAIAQGQVGDLEQALQTAEEILSLYPQVDGTDDNVHRFLWSAARVLHAAGRPEQAGSVLEQAYHAFQASLRAIPDAESRQAFADMVHNRQIVAAHERGDWPGEL